MEIKGTIIKIDSFEKGDFWKKEVILESKDGNYTNVLPVEFIKDRTDLVANYNVGDEIEVSINLKGREWNGRYFVSLEGWKVKGASAPSAPSTPDPLTVLSAEDDSDGLPF